MMVLGASDIGLLPIFLSPGSQSMGSFLRTGVTPGLYGFAS